MHCPCCKAELKECDKCCELYSYVELHYCNCNYQYCPECAKILNYKCEECGAELK